MPRVLVRESAYEYPILKGCFFEIMDALGGEGIGKDAVVLIKPNLLAPAPPEKAIVTHPLFVRAAVEYVLNRGGRPQVSDSPAMGSFDRVLRESGIGDAVKGLDVQCREFRDSELVDIGPPFNKIEIARNALKADVIINLPKLKTHTQMFLTLGVKNLFGCVVGLRKPEWHFRTGVDREMFARLLVQIYALLRPSFTILDGILVMEGQGPGRRGTPRRVGAIIGSDDALAVDQVVCRMLGVETERLLTNKVGGELGLLRERTDLVGDLPRIENFSFPDITPLVFGPKPLHRVMRKHLVQRPVPNDQLCRLCGECWKYCPAKAITHGRGKKRLAFDYEKCIRCYCCIEVCPQGALSARETLPGKVVRKVIRKRG